MKCIGRKAINFIWPIAVLALLLACGSGSQTGATVVVTHDTSTIAAGVDHISYTGLDAGGNTIYGPIELDKTDSHTLFGVPIQGSDSDHHSIGFGRQFI